MALAAKCAAAICIGVAIGVVVAVWGLIGWGRRAMFGVTVSIAQMDCASAGPSDAQGVELITQVGQHLHGRNVVTTSPCLQLSTT